jgi:hypothetical protein
VRHGEAAGVIWPHGVMLAVQRIVDVELLVTHKGAYQCAARTRRSSPCFRIGRVRIIDNQDETFSSVGDTSHSVVGVASLTETAIAGWHMSNNRSNQILTFIRPPR